MNLCFPFTSIIVLIIYIFFIRFSLQQCPDEVTDKGLTVTWSVLNEKNISKEIISKPECFSKDRLVTRKCVGASWFPSAVDLIACENKVDEFRNALSCPPGYHGIASGEEYKYCYEITTPSSWNDPCLRNGAASTIADLSNEEVKNLLSSLQKVSNFTTFWLPARRTKNYNPLLWQTAGPHWGSIVQINNTIKLKASMFANCLLLDTTKQALVTNNCSYVFPSVCIYINDFDYHTTCPSGYYALRFISDRYTCIGIEWTNSKSVTFESFYKTKCPKPLGNSNYDEVMVQFLFTKIAELNRLPVNQWCWFKNTSYSNSSINSNYLVNTENTLNDNKVNFTYLIINKKGSVTFTKSTTILDCMACETDVIYSKEPELLLEYEDETKEMYLTIYSPSGLWKYSSNDTGIRCFSNEKGFANVVHMFSNPFINISCNSSTEKEKIVYLLNFQAVRSAQYWCEGHSTNFSLIGTNKIIVNPKSGIEHVFSLVVKIDLKGYNFTNIPEMCDLVQKFTKIFVANKVLVMDLLEMTSDYLTVLFHLHVPITNEGEYESTNINQTYNDLLIKAEVELTVLNFTLVNISSSTHCLPSTTFDKIKLDWELTLIQHVAAPTQFCLQENGLPVKRHCYGSYLLGGYWGEVEGYCDENFEPTNATTYLYSVASGNAPENRTSKFLTEGLGFVFEDVDIIIPADIYYLSMSLQNFLNFAQKNDSHVDMGDFENIAWIMDRVMNVNQNYLALSQTLNSTNVILDSIDDIITILAKRSTNNMMRNIHDKTYQVAVKPNFVTQISYPLLNNISGIALLTHNSSINFAEMIVKPLYMNTTLNEIMTNKNLEVAVWFSESTLKSLYSTLNNSDNIKEDMHIIINMYYNDVVFQEIDSTSIKVNSRILGISTPGYISNLKFPVTMVFKVFYDSNYDSFCGYWNFEDQKSKFIPGYWSRNGCFLEKTFDKYFVCKCYHMTHFGQLLNIGNLKEDGNNIVKSHQVRALNVITLVGCFLSCLGVIGIWITAIVFKNWRKKAGTKILLQLSAAILLPIVIIIIYNFETQIFVEVDGVYNIESNMRITCILLGALLHYSVLASFVWMLITAILQFVRYVRVLGVCRPYRFMIKFAVIGWGAPLVPVIVLLLIDPENYVPEASQDSSLICYPQGFSFVFAVAVPIAITLAINVVLFISVISAISRGPDGKIRLNDMDLIGAQLRLSIFLFFLLGLTWWFGIMSFSKNLLWAYLFCLSATLQGFILFVYFVICDPATRALWMKLVAPQFRQTSSRQSIISITSENTYSAHILNRIHKPL